MTMKFYDGGTEINADLIPKLDLGVTCAKDSVPGKEELLCTMTLADQQGEDEFYCQAYQPK